MLYNPARASSLIIIERFLPRPVGFDSNLYASEDHLLASTEIYSQLDNISVVDRPWPRLNARLTEANMIQKCA